MRNNYDKFENSKDYQLEGDKNISAISDNDSRDIATTLQKGRNTQSAPQQSSGGGAANTLSTMAMSSGDPTTMAVGMGLKTLSNVAEKRRQAAADNANKEMQRRSNLMAALSRYGSGVGGLGMA